jgi:hypothetical protein
MEDGMLVIPYLFSPMGNPITIGTAALHPSLQRNWRRLIRRLRAGRLSCRRVSRRVWNFDGTGEIASADHSANRSVSDLEYHIAFAWLLIMM